MVENKIIPESVLLLNKMGDWLENLFIISKIFLNTFIVGLIKIGNIFNSGILIVKRKKLVFTTHNTVF